MESINPISLFIKRAELHHTKEYISCVFESSCIGIVKDVHFIKKADTAGREYNGVIVEFHSWFMNNVVTQLLDQMNNSGDGTTKFMYNYGGRSGLYWYINVYKEPAVAVQVSTIGTNLSNEEMEKLVQSSMAKVHFMQGQQTIYENRIMDYEQKESRRHLMFIDLKCELEDKNIEIACLKRDHQREVEALQAKIQELLAQQPTNTTI